MDSSRALIKSILEILSATDCIPGSKRLAYAAGVKAQYNILELGLVLISKQELQQQQQGEDKPVEQQQATEATSLGPPLQFLWN